ncbi:hypothetical protein BGW41_000271 [Actinomortierella wolfii]|nr:hypothetical protein BGW41_000271 [Actinomortierella wolfii]
MARLSSSNGVVPPHAVTSDEDSDDSYYVPSTPFSRRLAQVDPSLYQGNGDEFCTVENLAEASAYVNHQLSTFGFPSNLQFNSTDEKQAVAIVTTLYKVLQQHQKYVEYREEMDENYRRLSSDHDITVNNLTTTKARLEKSEREVDILTGRISMLEDELRSEVEKHKNTREELRACKGNLQYTKSQFVHESRKKEQEINGLRDKVQKAINDRFNRSNIGITLLNPALRKGQSQHLPFQSKSLSAQSGTPTKTENELLLEEVVEQQRSKEAEIVAENEQLRKTLYTIHVELSKFLRNHVNSKNKDGLLNGFALPFNMVKDKIEAEIRDQLTTLGDQWAHRPAPEPTISPTELLVRDQQIQELQKEIEKLELELANSTKLVQGAQTMIDNMTNSQLLNSIQQFKLLLEESDMTASELDEAQAKIQQQREELAKEREKFTQACLDLGRQREQLAKERAEFEASKRTFQLEEFLAYLDDNSRVHKQTPENLLDLSLTPPPAYPEQQQSFKERPNTLAEPDRAVQQSNLLSAKRLATSFANDFQPRTKKPMLSRPSQPIGASQNFPSRTEDIITARENVEYGSADDGEDDNEDEPLLRTPTRPLGKMDRSLGLRDIAKKNAIAVAAAVTRKGNVSTANRLGQQPVEHPTFIGEGGRDLNSDNSDPLISVEDHRASSAAQKSKADGTETMPSSFAVRPPSIFSRRPPSTTFSFRSALSLSGKAQDQQPQKSSSTSLAPTTTPKTSSLATGATTTTAAKTSNQPAVTSNNRDSASQHISLESFSGRTQAIARAASSMAARKRSQVSSHEQQDRSRTVAAPSSTLSNHTTVQSDSEQQPSSSKSSSFAQQIYESNRRAFMMARTPK